ncbi:tetratricopeptide repeat protein [Egbenema bharatensis]|uniref:tetratricopeptide repeat protein n=1 Tax=Egbenema bharatensis TaxID=3463334 RepID=UPI003A8770F9
MTNVPLSTIGLNQQIYQQLKLSLGLNLRRQIFIAVCDDLNLRDRLAVQLQNEIGQSANHSPGQSYPRLVSLQLSLDDPNPLMQIAQWLTQFPPPYAEGQRLPMPAFQIVGVEHLTRQSPAVQRLFFTHLQTIERNLPLLDFSLLIWMTQPWFHAISHSAPEFWRCRTGVFEFAGDPTPAIVTLPERFQTKISSNGSGNSSGNGSGKDFENRPENGVTQKGTSGDAAHRRFSEQPQAGGNGTSSVQKGEADLSFHELHELTEQAIDLSLADLLLEDSALEDSAQTDFTLTDSTLTPFTLTDFIPIDSATTDSRLADFTFAEPASAPVDPSLEPTLDPATEALIDENPWMLLEDELEQLYEPEQPSIAANSALTSAGSLVDHRADELEDERQTEDGKAREFQAEDRAAFNQAQQESLIHASEAAVPIAPIAIHLPDALSHQPQIQLLLQQIERLHEQQAAAPVLGEAYRALGNFFRDRIEQGEATPQNLIVAIQVYEQTLLLLPEPSPLCVDVLNDLGNLYWMLSRTLPGSTEALACLQQGVQSYQKALTRIDPANKAQTYPMVQNNLGAAYADLARYQEPVDNLERSVQSYQQALRYRKPETDPSRYASTQNNLGTTYWNLAQHKEPTTNLKQAIVAYSEALRYYSPDQEPMNYAMIQNNLGTAYWNMSQHERPQNWLKLAVAAYTAALQYRTMATAPSAYAATQNNLGTAYWHIANQTEDLAELNECLSQAIVAYEAALQAAETLQQQQPDVPLVLNFDRFATHNNLGIAHYQVATESVDALDTTAQAQHLQAALYHHVQAEQGWQGRENLRQTAVSCIIQTVRTTYHLLGMAGQNEALSGIPGHLLSEVLPKL